MKSRSSQVLSSLLSLYPGEKRPSNHIQHIMSYHKRIREKNETERVELKICKSFEKKLRKKSRPAQIRNYEVAALFC